MDTAVAYPRAVRIWTRAGGYRHGLQLDAQRVVVGWDSGLRVQKLAEGVLKIAEILDYPANKARRKLLRAGRRLGISAGAKRALTDARPLEEGAEQAVGEEAS